MEDESLSSVDQFLRDNGFSISDTALGLASLSGDELLDDELLLSDAEERQPTLTTRRSRDEFPRFVLLEDEDLLRNHDQQRLSGDRTSEQRDDDAAASRSWASAQDEQEQDESLDRSMLFGGSELSLSSDTPPMGNTRGQTTLSAPPSAASSSSVQLLETPGASPFASVYQMTPQQKEEKQEGDSAAMVSAASSSSLPSSLLPSPVHSGSSIGSGRMLDDELNNALGVARSSIGRLSTSSRRSREAVGKRENGGSDSDQRSHQSKTSQTSTTQRVLFTQEGDEEQSIEENIHNEHVAESTRGSVNVSSSRWSVSRSGSCEDHVSLHKAEEENEDKSVRNVTIESGQISERGDAVDIDEGAWEGLNDLLRRNGLPALRFRRVGSGDVLPEKESLFNVIHDFGVQLQHKNETIQDLVLASKRNSRVQSRRDGELQSIEKKKEDTRKALEKAQAEIQRLKVMQKQESENSELLSKKLKNSCLRLQQQLKVSEHRVKAKEVLVERMQTKLQQQVDKENMSKTRDRRAFRNLQDRDPRRANPRDSQALEAIGVYEAQREQMQEEMDYLKSQVAALNSELRDKDNFIARQETAALKHDPPVWEHYSDADSASGSQSRLRHRPGSTSVASDEMMLEQLEAARRDQEMAAAKLRHREAVMLKKVAMIEQELLTARETIAELKEETANLTLEAESRPSIRDYRLSQRRIHQLERQVAENKLALEEASDLAELRKYMGTKELVERDRLNHRLHLNRLNTLPRETTLEVVKHVCRVLHLTDITLVAPSLDKLCSVVAAVPRMEKFIRDVCGFVFLHLNENIETKDERFELEQVLPTLQQWMMERRKLHVLEGFKASIITELCKRAVEPSILDEREDSSHEGSPPSHPTTLSRAVHIVSELVELEKSVIHCREIYTQAAAEVERRPNVLINQIVRHFSHLFQVKSLDGVLPKINETYLLVNEMKNFLHVIRDLLHLKKETSLVHCLNAIKERLQDDAIDSKRVRQSDESKGEDTNQENAYGGNSPNFVIEKRLSQPNAQGGNSDPDLVGVRQVRQMSILVRELKRELGAATMEEILPRTKRLMELLSFSIYNVDPEDDEDEKATR